MPPPAATAVLVRAATSPLPSSVTPVGRPQGSTTINPQITQVPPNTTGVSNVAIYYVPRRFTADSKLHVLLAEKCPDLINRNNRDYNLFQVGIKPLLGNFCLIWVYLLVHVRHFVPT